MTLEDFRALPASERDLMIEEAVYGGNQRARWVTFGFGDRPQIDDVLAYILATDGPLDDQKVADKIEAELQTVQNERSEIQLLRVAVEVSSTERAIRDLAGERLCCLFRHRLSPQL